MLSRLVIALVIAIVVGLACLLLAVILGALNVPIADSVGAFLKQWAWVIGILAGLYSFFTGWRPA